MNKCIKIIFLAILAHGSIGAFCCGGSVKIVPVKKYEPIDPTMTEKFKNFLVKASTAQLLIVRNVAQHTPNLLGDNVAWAPAIIRTVQNVLQNRGMQQLSLQRLSVSTAAIAAIVPSPTRTTPLSSASLTPISLEPLAADLGIRPLTGSAQLGFDRWASPRQRGATY